MSATRHLTPTEMGMLGNVIESGACGYFTVAPGYHTLLTGIVSMGFVRVDNGRYHVTDSGREFHTEYMKLAIRHYNIARSA